MRDEVREFAQTMERRLASKDEERGGNSWKGMTPAALVERLHVAGVDLVAAIDEADTAGTPPLSVRLAVITKAADLANFAMMIADVS